MDGWKKCEEVLLELDTDVAVATGGVSVAAGCIAVANGDPATAGTTGGPATTGACEGCC